MKVLPCFNAPSPPVPGVSPPSFLKGPCCLHPHPRACEHNMWLDKPAGFSQPLGPGWACLPSKLPGSADAAGPETPFPEPPAGRKVPAAPLTASSHHMKALEGFFV